MKFVGLNFGQTQGIPVGSVSVLFSVYTEAGYEAAAHEGRVGVEFGAVAAAEGHWVAGVRTANGFGAEGEAINCACGAWAGDVRGHVNSLVVEWFGKCQGRSGPWQVT